MAKSAKAQRVLASLTIPTKVEIRQPEFEPLKSLAALDLRRLSKGSHKIEIGLIKGGCCPHVVRAVIRNGMVVGCETESCKETRSLKPSRELSALIDKVRAEVQRGRKWEPVPVAQFIGNEARMQDLIIVGGGCIFICFFNHCIMCCWWPRLHCFIPDIYTGRL
jgi:hypothetical protein